MIRKYKGMNFINKLICGWTILKFLRVGIGSLILYSSLRSGHIAGIVIGGLFTLFALFTDGVCCTGGSCYTSGNKHISSVNENIEYEELGAK